MTFGREGTTRVPLLSGYRSGYRLSQIGPTLRALRERKLLEIRRLGIPPAALQAGGRWFEPSTAHFAGTL